MTAPVTGTATAPVTGTAPGTVTATAPVTGAVTATTPGPVTATAPVTVAAPVTATTPVTAIAPVATDGAGAPFNRASSVVDDAFLDDDDSSDDKDAVLAAFQAANSSPVPSTATTERDLPHPSPADDDFDIVPRRASPIADMIATITGSRRNLGIAAGAGGLLVIILAVAFCGGGSTSKQVAAGNTAATAAPAIAPTPAEPEPEPVAVAIAPDAAADPVVAAAPASPEPVEPVEPVEPAEPVNNGPTAEELAMAAEEANKPAPAPTPPTPKPTQPAPPAAKKLGGKQVVVESDAQVRENKPVAGVAKSDQTAIQKARAAYASGNQKLFAGDASGAIKFYKQSLGFYPAYVAGYRGLGLAYAQQGDKPKALQALRTYVGSAPSAKDVKLIRKRIASLAAK